MKNLGINVAEYSTTFEKLQNEAKTVVFLAVNHSGIWQPTAIIAMADTLKPFAKEAIQALKKMKKEIVMITGDNAKTAEAIAREVGIDRVLAKVLPSQKVEVIKKLQEECRTVAMVGDEIG